LLHCYIATLLKKQKIVLNNETMSEALTMKQSSPHFTKKTRRTKQKLDA